MYSELRSVSGANGSLPPCNDASCRTLQLYADGRQQLNLEVHYLVHPVLNAQP